MGCSSSSDVQGASKILDITGIDISTKAERPVRDLPVFKTRLQEIDYNSVIADGADWKDPHFKANVNALIDDTMMRNNRITQWQTLTWKRPKDVYD